MLNAAEITLACNQEPIPNGNYRVGHDWNYQFRIVSPRKCSRNRAQETMLKSVFKAIVMNVPKIRQKMNV